MALRLTIAGCSGGFAAPGTACSSYLVGDGHTSVVLDLGNGALANLAQHVGLDDIDAVVISHEHPDHWVDLAALRVALRYDLGIEGVPLLAPAPVVRAAEALCGSLAPTFAVDVVAAGDERAVGDLRLCFDATDHPVTTLACRVDGGGGSLLYSADTGPGWDGRALGVGVGALLCEATQLAPEATGGHHLTAGQAGALARALGVGRLLVTHRWPGVDPAAVLAQATAAFEGPVEGVVEHATYDVGPGPA